MKKITLFFALLIACIGAKAQTLTLASMEIEMATINADTFAFDSVINYPYFFKEVMVLDDVGEPVQGLYWNYAQPGTAERLWLLAGQWNNPNHHLHEPLAMKNGMIHAEKFHKHNKPGGYNFSAFADICAENGTLVACVLFRFQ